MSRRRATSATRPSRRSRGHDRARRSQPLPELQRFGATDISACFNCGVCSAICPLSVDGASFPRQDVALRPAGPAREAARQPGAVVLLRLLRMHRLVPDQADPASFMAAARRYAVASYDRTHLAYCWRHRGSSPASSCRAGRPAGRVHVLGPQAGGRLDARLLRVRPSDVVHNLGIVAMAVMGVAALSASSRWSGACCVGPSGAAKTTLRKVAGAAVYAVGTEVPGPDPLPQGLRRRHRVRRRCGPGIRSAGSSTSPRCGASSACSAPRCSTTAWNCSASRPTGTAVPIWYPVRLLGTLAGAAPDLRDHGLIAGDCARATARASIRRRRTGRS
jgi:ferredoxin